MSPSLIIIGASGDLARRLLFPALFHLEVDGRLGGLKIVGHARDDWDTKAFLAHLETGLKEFVEDFDAEVWTSLSERITFVRGEISAKDFAALGDGLADALFYLALPPSLFAEAATELAGAGLQDQSAGFRRLLIEKPFGSDVESALQLNEQIHLNWSEDQIFRIDHFLGKETVQNILVFRFANRFLEPVFNCHHIAEVQITAAETLGLEGRVAYYDSAGALRDMLQNHLMQLFAFTAIEPPALWDPEILRDHKVEVLKAVRPVSPDDVSTSAVRGRYTASGDTVGYLSEEGIKSDSSTETFAAIKLFVDNWRWKDVPFYLRSGKRMSSNFTEIALRFREPPSRLFVQTPLEVAEPNWLIFRLRPSEGIDLIAQVRDPGFELESRTVRLHTDAKTDHLEDFSAYELLLLDALEGDRTSFLRFDEVEWAWRIVQPILDSWTSGQPDDYTAGTDGPDTAEDLMPPGHSWRELTSTDG